MAPPRGPVIACVDGSSYLASVCDHAATIAARLGVGIELLHVAEPAGAADPAVRLHGQGRSGRDPVVQDAVARLTDNGAELDELFCADGGFVPVAARLARRASCLVLGRRGLASERRRSGLGGNIEQILRTVDTAVCLAPKLHLPGRRALILYDERRPNPGFAGFLASHPALDGFSFEIATIAPGAPAPTGGTRVTQLGGGSAPGQCPASALTQYFAEKHCDLIVAPRSVLLDCAEDMAALASALAAWRVPILFPPRLDP
ncbi:universal stress protein [Phenylobacterium sp.]|uniref:universal stress protein n=1 Tax=Phenylobacterium sp. TaxID=1871053 RepID=UPI0035B1F8F8